MVLKAPSEGVPDERLAAERRLTYVEVAGLPVGRRYFFRCASGRMWEVPAG